MTGPDWEPGVSDIDLLACLSADAAADEAALRRLWRARAALKRLLPMLGEIQACARPQLEWFARHGGLRAAEMGRWRRLLGARPPFSTAGGPEACLREAGFAFLCLQDAYFDRLAGRREACFALAKSFLDAVRCARAAVAGFGEPAARSEELLEFAARNDPALIAALRRPERISDDDAFRLFHVAFGVLENACPAAPAARPVGQPAAAQAVGAEDWARRLHALKGPGLPQPAGVYFDSALRWWVLVESRPEPARLWHLLDLLRRWHEETGRSGWALSWPVLHLLSRWPYLDSPFLPETLGSDGAFWRSPPARLPALEGFERWRWNVDAGRLPRPSVEQRRRSARAAAADLALTLPLYGDRAWDGPARFRLFHLAGRVLTLALFARTADCADPADLEDVLARCESALPERAESWRRLRGWLSTPPQDLDRMRPEAPFYALLPDLAALLEDARRELA